MCQSDVLLQSLASDGLASDVGAEWSQSFHVTVCSDSRSGKFLGIQ